ncbi:alpha/beta fold hydrolase [Patulibacter americanus]|uniref:alpha/beta fold hydrolase n=1 Tax=Patulibacter americanus TaxID=588672 RepID=UPI0003B31CEA|nr:alpha/beta fold hydrolase [Patulibacter americanus]
MASRSVLALHGFGGSSRSWDAVRDALPAGVVLIAPDLRGHGTAAGRRPVDLRSTLTDLEGELAVAARDAPCGRVALAGYSLGGRLALHLALARPELLEHVVLVSSTSGLEDEEERAARRAADEEQARFLEREGLEAFADRWATLPLWDGDPPAVRAAQRAAIADGDAAGLAAALRGLGAGAVPAVGHRLATLATPLTVVVGGRDRRYRAIGARVLGLAAQPAGEVVVPDAGHGLLREAPAAVAAALGALR